MNKKRFTEKPEPYIVLEPIPMEELVQAVEAKYPNVAVWLKHDGQLIYAISKSGRRRIVGCLAGVLWQPYGGNTYHVKTGQYLYPPPKMQLGKYSGPYMENIYPAAKDKVEYLKRASNSAMNHRYSNDWDPDA